MPEIQPHRVVVIGGGFGGLHAVRGLKHAPVDITLVDRRNFHLFQPLLYQVATGALSPANIAAPLRAILKKQKNVRVVLGEVIDIDIAARVVRLNDGEIPYDSLIVASGAQHHYFGHDDWQHFAPGLKTIEDATEMRRRILLAFEAAERETDPAKRRALLTFLVVGAGPTGAELAGALAEMAHHTLRENFRSINPADAQVLLIEAGERVLPSYEATLSARGAKALERIGVSVRTQTAVLAMQEGSVSVRHGDQTEIIPTHTVLWAAGVQGSPLGVIVHQRTGVAIDRAGRVVVEPDCGIAGFPEIFVIGDLANYAHGTELPLPGVAPVAMQQGDYVATVIAARLRGAAAPPPFRYHNRGSMAVIGRAAAVADIFGVRFAGLLAWLAWLFIHLMFLVQFDNRALVLMQWAWHYLTWNRSARLITGSEAHGQGAPLGG